MKKILALTAGMLMMASLAFAKDITPGTFELTGSTSGGFSSYSSDGSKKSEFNIELDGFYYLMPNFGVGVLFDVTSYGKDSDGTYLDFGPEVIYNFPIHEAMNAYGKAVIGYRSWDYGSATDQGLIMGADAGVRYFFTDAAAVDCGLAYTHGFGDLDSDEFELKFGLSVFFNPYK